MVRQRRTTLDNLLQDVSSNAEVDDAHRSPPSSKTIDMRSAYRYLINRPFTLCLAFLAVLTWLFLSPHGRVSHSSKASITTTDRCPELLTFNEGSSTIAIPPPPSSLQPEQEFLSPPSVCHHPQLPRPRPHQLWHTRDRRPL